jgi:Protein of unknown function (DUF3501)
MSFMKLGLPIGRENLMSLESYDLWRKTHKIETMSHRRLRSVLLGAHVLVQFESELSVRYQIQEMLRVEKIFDAAGIQHEIDAYAPLVPSGTNWMATLMIEYVDALDRKQALAQLIGIEDHVQVKIDGFDAVQAIADEDMDRETEAKTSAVHFLRFELTAEQRQAVCQGAGVMLSCDHPKYQAQAVLPQAMLESLRMDFE